MSDFVKGMIVGLCAALVIAGVMAGLALRNKKDRELIEYAEQRMEIEALREDYGNRAPIEFLGEPDIRRAVDGAAADFQRKRDDILFRFRSGISD